MTTETPMLERVARAMAGHFGQNFDDLPKDKQDRRDRLRSTQDYVPDHDQSDVLEAARAALEAMLEPSIDMCAAGRAFGDDYAAGDVWKAMIQAALDGA